MVTWLGLSIVRRGVGFSQPGGVWRRGISMARVSDCRARRGHFALALLGAVLASPATLFGATDGPVAYTAAAGASAPVAAGADAADLPAGTAPVAMQAQTPARVPEPGAVSPGNGPRPVKVLIITLFAPEAQPWIEPLGLDQFLTIPGLSADYPALRCNRDDVCLLTTGMGHANAAASTLAVALDPQLDLRQTWFLVAGIAGIDPAMGTLGSAAWARYLVDVGIAQELDAREMPLRWPAGYLGVMTTGPGVKPKLEYGTEVFHLDERLLSKVLSLTQAVVLADSPAARAYGGQYREAAARSAPRVLQCDTLSGDTWWHGRALGDHARRWTRLLTDGQGRYCTTQQEDNAIAAALARAGRAGRVDPARLMVLRTGANFDRPHPGQSAYASLRADSGGFAPAVQNLYRVGSVAVNDIVSRWTLWAQGVPEP